ncbi:alpha/beta hydrolase [Fusibacter paucivorans]|uniref:Alpha/beta hydrolase n=1 Tax=Fusibacter paucivorans TaxID=76009 RepID=A0ABS5PMK0_9FIRM|nr:alpha/beta hydrolase [Fusibacter paucivorans]MBS7526122.1 alpha/beta hydrolase [Fusibacter paucivorans]
MHLEIATLKDNFYANVQDVDFAPYADFCKANPKRVSTDGIPYYTMGEGPVLLCLPGSTGKALTFYPYFEQLTQYYQVIAIDYPVATGIEDLTLKLMQFIRSEQIDRFYIFANSFGTVAAQALASKMPEQVAGIVLTHAVTKTKDVPAKTSRRNQKSLKSFIKSIRFLNFARFQKKFSKQLQKNFTLFQNDTSKRLFWEGIFIEMLYDTSKQEMMSNYGFMQDFWDRYVFEEEHFSEMKAKVTLVESHRDHEQNLPEKTALRALFKDADYIVMPGDSQLSLVKNQAAILKAVVEMLES